MADCLRGHDETIGERLKRDLAALQTPLPAAYDACEKVATTVSSLSLVHYRRNDYSVPTTYGHRNVLVRGYVHEVVISMGELKALSTRYDRAKHPHKICCLTSKSKQYQRQLKRRPLVYEVSDLAGAHGVVPVAIVVKIAPATHVTWDEESRMRSSAIRERRAGA